MEAKIKNDVVKAIFDRKSIRGYKPEPITPDELETLLVCAMQAPSGKNAQAWLLKATQNKALIEEISAYVVGKMRAAKMGDQFLLNRPDYCVFHHAPNVVFVAVEKAFFTGKIDAGCLAQNFCLAATSMGLGSCMIGFVHGPLKEEEGKPFLKKLNVPDTHEVLFALIAGYPTRNPPDRGRDHSRVEFID